MYAPESQCCRVRSIRYIGLVTGRAGARLSPYADTLSSAHSSAYQRAFPDNKMKMGACARQGDPLGAHGQTRRTAGGAQAGAGAASRGRGPKRAVRPKETGA